jgi:hypothetical protein
LTPTIPAPSPTPCPHGPTPDGALHSPTHMADQSRTDALAPDHHRVSTVRNGPPDHPVHRKLAHAACRQAAHVTDHRGAHTTGHRTTITTERPTPPTTEAAPTAHRRMVPTIDRQAVRVTDRECMRPASLRPVYPTRHGPSASRSWRAAVVITPARQLRTGPPPGCATWSRSGMPPAPIPAAGGPQRTATLTTRCLTTEGAEPACATWGHYAAATINSSKRVAGRSNKPAPAP